MTEGNESSCGGVQRKSPGSNERMARARRSAGGYELAEMLLVRIVPNAPAERSPPSRRARLKSPLRYRYLSWRRTDDCVVTTSGRVALQTTGCRSPRCKACAEFRGRFQRRLRLVTVHPRHGGTKRACRDRDVAEAGPALGELIELGGRRELPRVEVRLAGAEAARAS